MIEEEARLENTSPEASKSDEKIEGQKSLTDKNNDLLTGTLEFKQIQEKKMEITTGDQSGNTQLSDSAQDAIKKFKKIKESLAGAEPEWRLPKVDRKAFVSAPKLIEPELISKDCKREGRA
jgi:hypothetical protein